MPSVVEALKRALVSVLLEVARVYSLSLILHRQAALCEGEGAGGFYWVCCVVGWGG